MATDTATTTLASCPRHLRRAILDTMVDLALPHMTELDAVARVAKAWETENDVVGIVADVSAAGDPVGDVITYLDQLYSAVYSKQVRGPTNDVRDRMYKALMRRAFADREWGKQMTVLGGLEDELSGVEEEDADLGSDGYSLSSLSSCSDDSKDGEEEEEEEEEEEDDSSSEDEEEEESNGDSNAAKRQKREQEA